MATENNQPRPLPKVRDPRQEAEDRRVSEEIRVLTNQLRENRDAPEEERRKIVADIFKSAVKIAQKGDKTDSLVAYKELKGIKDEIAGLTFESQEESRKFNETYLAAVKSAENSSSMLGVIAHDLKDSSKKMFPTLSSFGKSLISNSHPAIQVALDLAKETREYYKDAKGRAEAANDEAHKANAQEADALLSELELQKRQEEVADLQAEAAKAQIEAVSEPAKAKREGPMVSRLEAIKVNGEQQLDILAAVHNAITDNDPIVIERKEPQPEQELEVKGSADAEAVRLEDNPKLDRTNELLEQIAALFSEQNKIHLATQERESRDRLRALENENKGGNYAVAGFDRASKGGEDEKQGDNFVSSFLGNLLGGKGKGAAGALMKLLKGGGKAIPVVGQVIAVAMAAFDFFDGFSNAADILGKEEVNLRDKISAGVGSLVGGIVGIADSLLGLFGVETDMGGYVKEKLSKGLSYVLNSFDGMFDGAVDAAVELKDDIIDGMDNFASSLRDQILTWATEIPKAVMDMLPGLDTLKSGWEKTKNFFGVEEKKEDPVAKLEVTKPQKFSDYAKRSESELSAAEDKRRREEQAELQRKAVASIVQSTKVDASTTNVFSQPVSARNKHTSAWAGS